MSTLNEANSAFSEGDYQRAFELYSLLIEEQPKMAASFRYNLELARQRLAGKPQKLSMSPVEGALWYWVKQLRSSATPLTWFSGLATETSFEGFRDVLAYAATNGRYRWYGLASLLESYRIPLFRERTIAQLQRRGIWKRAWLELAMTLYGQRHTEMDMLDALSIYELTEELFGQDTLQNPKDLAFYGDLLSLHGKFDKARAVLTPTVSRAQWILSHEILRLNTINPNLTGKPEHLDNWLDGFNGVLQKEGLAPIYFAKPGKMELLDIRSEAPKVHVEDGPKISIIMPIYEPNEYTDLAIASLLNQTWTNLEIIIVDDASPKTDSSGQSNGYREQLEKWASSDDRIRLIFCEENRGTYAVRNDGLDAATGDLVTVADKDDWHHPQKLELQARDLMMKPDSLANLTNWVRVDEAMRLLPRSRQGHVVYPAFASIMFRRKEVMSQLGYWDKVRKAGDAEFKSRLQKVFGITLTPAWNAPMAISFIGAGNLTSSDMRPGYISPDRRAYQRAYSAWHRLIREGEKSPYLPKEPPQRPFVAPRGFLPERSSLAPPHYDVVFLSEFGFLAGNSTSLLQEIRVCIDRGLKVGVLPIRNGLMPSAARRHIHPNIEQLVEEGSVDKLTMIDEAQIDLLVVRWPASFQLGPGARLRIDVARIVVVANHMPYEVDGSRRSYDVRTVSDNLQVAFGKRPLWSGQSERIEEFLKPLVPPGEMAPFTWKGIIEPEAWDEMPLPDTARVPIIGRHARDMAGKWPSTSVAFRQVYPIDGSVHVKIMGGAATPVKSGLLPANPGPSWTVIPFNGLPVKDYLRSLDFFVYYHGKGLVEAFGMAILEALNNGVVAVLPPHFKAVFQDAAVYAEPAEVKATLQELWNAESYSAQRQRGFDFIRKYCTPDAYVGRLRQLGVDYPRTLSA